MNSVLITGGTGTLGHALVRHYLQQGLQRVVVYSRDEVKQAAMQELFGKNPAFRAFLGDVRDVDRLRQACHGVELVVAAAALKRVDATAYNPTELLATNVVGVQNTIKAACSPGWYVPRVIVVSSDKAVLPTTAYGLSKAFAESLAIHSNSWSYPHGTAVSVVRYGNVIGSRGSVFGTWARQAAAGLPLTITDQRMTRFLMGIDRAVKTVQFCADHMRGGEVFVPVLPSARMTAVAKAIFPVATQHVTGLRPGGEKLHEVLISPAEVPRTWWTKERQYYVVMPDQPSWAENRPLSDYKVDSGFEYTSGTGTWVMSPDDIVSLVRASEVTA